MAIKSGRRNEDLGNECSCCCREIPYFWTLEIHMEHDDRVLRLGPLSYKFDVKSCINTIADTRIEPSSEHFDSW